MCDFERGRILISILIYGLVGLVIGWKFFPEKWNKANINVQLLSTLVLIFSMGVSLGSRPSFLREVSAMGMKSLVFAVLAILGSIIVVYPLTRKYLVGLDLREGEEKE